MAASYLQSSMDKIPEARDPKLIELCINPDGTLWAEFQGDHFMRSVNRRLSPNEIKDLGQSDCFRREHHAQPDQTHRLGQHHLP